MRARSTGQVIGRWWYVVPPRPVGHWRRRRHAGVDAAELVGTGRPPGVPVTGDPGGYRVESIGEPPARMDLAGPGGADAVAPRMASAARAVAEAPPGLTPR